MYVVYWFNENTHYFILRYDTRWHDISGLHYDDMKDYGPPTFNVRICSFLDL